jgi:hypothetical protein
VTYDGQWRQCLTAGCSSRAARGGLCGSCFAAARRMSAAFKSRREIAAHFGITVDTLRDVLKRTGAYAPKASDG